MHLYMKTIAMINLPTFAVRYAPSPIELIDDAEPQTATTTNTATLSVSLKTVLVIFLLLSLLYTAYLAKTLLLPIVLAIFLATCTSPLVKAFPRFVPRSLSSGLVVITTIMGLVFLCAALTTPVNSWLADASNSAQSIAPKVRALARPMEMFRKSVESVLITSPVSQVNVTDSPSEKLFDPWSLVTATPKVAALIMSVILLFYFFLAYGADIFRRAVELAPTLQRKKRTIAIVRAIQSDTSRYLATVSAINLALGVATTVLLWAFGFPSPWIFGLVACVFNFIPYVGPITTAVVIAGFGLLHFNSNGAVLFPAASFVLITLIEGQMVSPWILGKYLSLSPVAILLWLMLWGWIWGIGGIFLSVPMLMVLKIVCERFDNTQWISRAIE